MFIDLINVLKFLWTKRRILPLLKIEFAQIRDKILKAKADSNISKAELKGILAEVEDLLSIILEKM